MEVPAPDFLAAQVNSYVGTSYFNGNLWVRRWSISRRMNKCLCEKDPILVENTSHTPDVYICLFFGFLVPLFHVFQLLFGCLAEWNVIRLKGLSLTIELVKTSEIKQECRVPTCTTFTDIGRRTFPELDQIGWGYTCKVWIYLQSVLLAQSDLFWRIHQNAALCYLLLFLCNWGV